MRWPLSELVLFGSYKKNEWQFRPKSTQTIWLSPLFRWFWDVFLSFSKDEPNFDSFLMVNGEKQLLKPRPLSDWTVEHGPVGVNILNFWGHLRCILLEFDLLRLCLFLILEIFQDATHPHGYKRISDFKESEKALNGRKLQIIFSWADDPIWTCAYLTQMGWFNQLMVNWWFGAPWFGFLRLWKGFVIRITPTYFCHEWNGHLEGLFKSNPRSGKGTYILTPWLLGKIGRFDQWSFLVPGK